MIRIDTDSYHILGQKYGLPSQKCGMSASDSDMHDTPTSYIQFCDTRTIRMVSSESLVRVSLT